jgi:raffinose/stachyose/melibiose transport system permease protein
MSKKRNYLTAVQSFIANTLMILLSFSCIFPMIWIGYSSLKSNTELFGNMLALPKSPRWDNLWYVLTQFNIQHYLKNTLIHTVVSLVFIIILGFIVGYFLSRYSFRGRNLIYMLFLSGILVPIHALIVPIFMEFHAVGITNTRLSLILPYIIFGLPGTVFLVDAYVRGIPIEMEEAALTEGATIFQTLWRLIFPMCKPVLVTVLVLSFNSTWNEFIFNLTMVSGDRLKNISVALRTFGNGYSVDYVRLMAAVAVATLPVLIIYIIFNKQIIEGMVEGAVKG